MAVHLNERCVLVTTAQEEPSQRNPQVPGDDADAPEEDVNLSRSCCEWLAMGCRLETQYGQTINQQFNVDNAKFAQESLLDTKTQVA